MFNPPPAHGIPDSPPRATFALMLSILPATATAIGFLVPRQAPTIIELLGIALVAVGVGIHRPAQARDLPFLERT